MLFETETVPQTSERAVWRAVADTLSLTERIVGIVDGYWDLFEIKYHGTGTRRKAFEQFDEILCGILLQVEFATAEELKSWLGLSDNLGSKAFFKMLSHLKDSMIEGDETYFTLTKKGRLYAVEGYKFDVFHKDFSLLTDPLTPNREQAQVLAQSLGAPKHTTKMDLGDIPSDFPRDLAENLVWQREMASHQATQVHLPEKGFYLDHAQIKSIQRHRYPIQIAVIENFATQQTRFKAIKAHSPEFLPEITEHLNSEATAHLKEIFLQPLFPQAPEAEESAILEATELQQADEAWAREQEIQLQKAKSPENRTQLKAQIESQRKNLDAPAFEEELTWLANTCREQLWLISPWVRRRAFAQREQQIRKLLRRGCRVYVGYSEAYDSENRMVDPEALEQMEDLAAKFSHFHFCELPSFHEKLVFALVSKEQKFEYTGSFNVLSLYAGSIARISRENMRRLAWDAESDQNLAYFQKAFADHFLAQFTTFWPELLEKSVADFKDFKSIEQKLDLKHQQLTEAIQATHPDQMDALDEQMIIALDRLKSKRQEWLEGRLQAIEKEAGMDTPLPDSQAKNLRRKLQSLKTQWAEGAPDDRFAAMMDRVRQLNAEWNFKDLHQQVETAPGDFNAHEKKKWEQKLAQLKQNFVAESSSPPPIIETIATLIRKKSKVAGLKIVGKIDLPKTKKSSSKSKKK